MTFFFFSGTRQLKLAWCVLFTWTQPVITTVLTPGGLASPQLSFLLRATGSVGRWMHACFANRCPCYCAQVQWPPLMMWHDCSKGKAMVERTLEQQTGLWGMARILTLNESSCCNNDSHNEGQQTAEGLLVGGGLWQNDVNWYKSTLLKVFPSSANLRMKFSWPFLSLRSFWQAASNISHNGQADSDCPSHWTQCRHFSTIRE